jgi:hypothetical protein
MAQVIGMSSAIGSHAGIGSSEMRALLINLSGGPGKPGDREEVTVVPQRNASAPQRADIGPNGAPKIRQAPCRPTRSRTRPRRASPPIFGALNPCLWLSVAVKQSGVWSCQIAVPQVRAVYGSTLVAHVMTCPSNTVESGTS